MKLLIAGGGTGGHVYPALEVAREWMSRGPEREVVIVGTKRGIEAKLVPAAGLPLETIRVAGLKGMGAARLARNVALLPVALWDSLAILRRHHFAAAFGVGGYAAGPVQLAAALKGIPQVIFEPNAEPGFTNRVLAPLARRVATSWDETAQRWGRKGAATGCPARREFFDAPAREHKAPFRVLITGGSQGARPINRAMAGAVGLLEKRKELFFLVHQTGERDYNDVRTAYAQSNLRAEVVPYLERMAEEFARADLIVCRSGAMTVAEITAAGRAAILIPFGAATDSHQLANARVLERAGAARVIPQPEASPERLAREILELLDQPAQLAQMEKRARSLAKPRAAAAIADLLEEVARR